LVLIVRGLIFMLVTAIAAGQTDPAGTADKALNRAYELLRSKDYDNAIAQFRAALALSPGRAAAHKDLAYTLLKTGDTEQARDEFGAAMRLDPSDDHVALEYAFLCFETKQQAVARRIFDRIRKKGNPTAEQAFENIDRPLREGIERWMKAVELSPDNFSAHEELARLAEQRDQLTLAAEHYEKAWRLRPDRRSLLLDLGRVWKAMDRNDDAMSALLAASRGSEPRVAEQARELLPSRYPFIYEFERALALDPTNVDLRRELAYLHLEMKNPEEAEKEFETVVEGAPDDLLSAAQLGFLRLSRGDADAAQPLLERVLAGNDDELADRVRVALHLPQVLHRRPEEPRAVVSGQAKELADKSLEKGYLKDALKYLQVAHENDPLDFDVILKLGRTYNIMKDDEDAVRWFDLARRSPDPQTAAEASRAYNNLHPQFELFRTTVWAAPAFSTRWHDLFGYGQVKTELRLPRWWLHPYASARFIGDTKGAVNVANIGPEYLSERSVILGFGVATSSWRGANGWFEAGESLRYSPTQIDPGRVVPDYRGGVSYGKGWGGLLSRGAHGWYAETNDDGVYVSRFAHDTLLYSQNRTGYTFRSLETAGLHAQLYWNWNATVDALGQYWANYAETGPGVKFRFESWQAPVTFSVAALRGAYLVNTGNPRGPNYNDVRVSLWYAFTK
jgi:Tfp pilus assembly protein PilF